MIIKVFGQIGKQVTEEEILNQMEEANGEPISFYINSLGGSIPVALGIQTAIQMYNGPTEAVFMGYVASCATWIGMPCDKVVMNQYGRMMIHRAMGNIGFAHEDQFETTGEDLRKIDQELINMYVTKTGQDAEVIRDLMTDNQGKGSVFTADEALAIGFIDEIVSIGPENQDLADLQNIYEPEYLKLANEMNVEQSLKTKAIKKSESIKNDAKKDREIEVLKRRNKRLQSRA